MASIIFSLFPLKENKKLWSKIKPVLKFMEQKKHIFLPF